MQQSVQSITNKTGNVTLQNESPDVDRAANAFDFEMLVIKQILVRQQYLEDLIEIIQSKPMQLTECVALLGKIRVATVQCVEAICQWRRKFVSNLHLLLHILRCLSYSPS